LPDLQHAKVVWPRTYSWTRAPSRLDPIRKALSRLLPVEVSDVAEGHVAWRSKGGFPVPIERQAAIGSLCNPVGPYDIRGEIFEIHRGARVVRCAFDYSDYPIVSTAIQGEVDLYFKCVAPPADLASNVRKIGYFPRNPSLLAKARAKVLRSAPEKRLGIYGRFGAWTDSQSLRAAVVEALQGSSLDFTGGFAVSIYPAYLKEIMSARVALHLPGQGPLSYRMVEAMALGTVVVSPKVACAFPEDLLDGVHYVALNDDGSNVVEVCGHLLRDADRRQSIAERAMVFFDRNFSTESMARRILRTTLEPGGS